MIADVLTGKATWHLECSDVLAGLAMLPDSSVQVVCTSVPYWNLRDYGTGYWEGGLPDCDHKRGVKLSSTKRVDGGIPANNNHAEEPYKDLCGKCGAKRIDKQLGLESTPQAYVEAMVAVFREVRRVLRIDGTCWLNIGDSYSGGSGGSGGDQGGTGQRANRTFTAKVPRKDGCGLKPKDLSLIPQRLAIALQDDGWWVRSEITWCKRAPMPESVTDRPTSATEKIYLLTKSQAYYYDADAVREVGPGSHPRGLLRSIITERHDNERLLLETHPNGANMRNFWLLSPEAYPEAHFATFPSEIPRRAIRAGSRPGDVVLDCFAGSGTTLSVAVQLGRRALGIELSPEYCRLAERRMSKEAAGYTLPMELEAV